MKLLAFTASAFSATTLTVGELESQGGQSAMVRFKRGKTEAPLTLPLQQYATNLVDQISGQLTDGTLNSAVIENAKFVSDLSANRAVWKTKTSEPAERGSYTIVMPSAGTNGARQGSRVGIATVGKNGAIASAFALADGAKASQGTFLSKNGEWPLFVSLYKNKGVLTGAMDFTEEPGVSDFDGAVNWTRPSAFTTALGAKASPEPPPATSARLTRSLPSRSEATP